MAMIADGIGRVGIWSFVEAPGRITSGSYARAHNLWTPVRQAALSMRSKLPSEEGARWNVWSA